MGRRGIQAIDMHDDGNEGSGEAGVVNDLLTALADGTSVLVEAPSIAVRLPSIMYLLDTGQVRAMSQTVFSQLADMAERTARRSPAHFSMPAHTIKAIEQHGVAPDLIERLFGSRAKITKLTAKNEDLNEEQTDRAIRLLRIISLAEKVFRNPSKAMMWLNNEHKQFKSKPIDLLVRETGANLVEQMLLRIEYGVYA